MTDAWTPERRRGRRVPVPFALVARADGDGPWRVRELGTGGVLIESGRALAAGRDVRLMLESDDHRVGPLAGHIAHSRVILPLDERQPSICRAGVTFDHLTPGQHDQLAALITAVDQRRLQRPRLVP